MLQHTMCFSARAFRTERGPGIIGIRRDTWNVGETRMWSGRERVNKTGLNCQKMVKDPKSADLALSPGWKQGGSQRRWSAFILWCWMAWLICTWASSHTCWAHRYHLSAVGTSEGLAIQGKRGGFPFNKAVSGMATELKLQMNLR